MLLSLISSRSLLVEDQLVTLISTYKAFLRFFAVIIMDLIQWMFEDLLK